MENTQNISQELLTKAKKAKQASQHTSTLTTNCRNNALLRISAILPDRSDEIIAANKIDLENARQNGMSEAMLDRLKVDKKRIEQMAEGVRQVASQVDPIGKIISDYIRVDNLRIKKKVVPLGVIGVIYESRPNVTVDTAALTLKSGNAVILKGGKEAINTNKAIVKILQEVAYNLGIPEGTINLIEDTARETTTQLMGLKEYVDLLIPRGGKGLIRSVVENAKVPVIETGAGNCHVYIEKECSIHKAKKVLINAKVSRPSVCNSCESLLIDEEVAKEHLKEICDLLKENNVEIRGCKRCLELVEGIIPATDEDWETEYDDYIISVKVVSGIDEAIRHINRYSTKHSEAIITENSEKAQKFLNEIDSAAVYVNASTRFTDGFEFGIGAEIGISTQKLHARGPMGAQQLTTVKYIILGDGHIRE